MKRIENLAALNSLPEQAVVRNIVFGVVFECVAEIDGSLACRR